MLVSVELCSLTLQRDDVSVTNVIATGLFGDGAAAVVLGGRRARGASAGAARRRDALGLLPGHGVGDGLGRRRHRLQGRPLREGAGGHPGERRAATWTASSPRTASRAADVRHWIAHTGGPKVLEAFRRALDLPEAALARSWRSLAEVGNLSSASVLFVLGDLLDAGEARPGDVGLLAAMGPGFSAELVLLRW